MLAYGLVGAFDNLIWLNFLKEKKLPENDRPLPLTWANKGAMEYSQSVIYGSYY